MMKGFINWIHFIRGKGWREGGGGGYSVRKSVPAHGPLQAVLFVIAIKMICVERLQYLGTSHGKGRRGGGVTQSGKLCQLRTPLQAVL